MVRCYHCEHEHSISSRATRVSCPKCAKSLLVQNVTIRTTEGWSHFKTCGKVTILTKGKLVAKTIVAHDGIEVRGGLDAQSYVGGPVVLKKSATWRGDCSAPSVEVDAGACVIGGMFDIAPRA
jgi:predicted RNA-binding Zn-ribbon protein involved in translation (DUF1610 family)